MEEPPEDPRPNDQTQTAHDAADQIARSAPAFVVSSPPPGSGSKPKKRLFTITAVLFVLIICGFAAYYLSHKKSHDNPGKNSSTTTATHGTKNPTLVPAPKQYRLFQSYAGTNGNQSTVTLADASDTAIATAKVTVPLHLLAELQNKYFILKQDDSLATVSPDDYGGHYWLLDSAGKLSPINGKVDSALRKDAGTENEVGALYPISDNQVLYYQCASSDDQYCGTLHTIDILNGTQRTYQAGQGQLIGVSNDGQIAYLLTLDFQSGSFAVIDYDLSSQKVTKRTALKGLPQQARQLWVSPNGNSIAYADEQADVITILNRTSGNTVHVPTPKEWELNSWSGEVNLPVPEWSPDEQNIAFVAWTQSAQYLVNVNVSAASYKILHTLDTSANAPESTYGPGLNHASYDGMIWMDTQKLDFTTANLTQLGAFGTAVGNYTFNLSDGQTAFHPTTYGEILGINSTRMAIQGD